jgi:hypothetical protein
MLHLNLSSLKAGRAGSVTGEIWFDGDFPFPEVGWSDFPIEVLAWWLELLGKLASGEITTGQVSFMDGPYRIRALVSGDVLRVEFLSEHPGVHGGSRVTSLASALTHAIATAIALLDECRRRTWNSEAISNLQRTLTTIQAQSRTETGLS